MQSQDSIQVHIRIRSAPTPTLYFQHTPSCLQLGKTSFTFDQIYAPSTTQPQIFTQTGLKSITHALEGYNSCIFVYGQTGSGKTYTMVGGDGGIIQRSLEYLFSQIEETSRVSYVITCSYYQIYNEQLYDLLDTNDKKKLNIREDIKKGIFIQGLHQQSIDASNKGMQLLNQGIRSRHVAQTMMNRESSRSHSIFTLNIQSSNNKIIKTSKLHFVDLAGSERQKASLAQGERLKQASNINKSLTTLGMVINSLSSQKSKVSHIPFRDSKLTFVLRDSLNGNSKTYLIATISANSDYFQQTLSTLKFAQRVKMVKLKARINEQSLISNVDALKEEIRRLKQENRNVMMNLEKERSRTKNEKEEKDEFMNYNEVILESYNNNVVEINQKINSIVELLPRVTECKDEEAMAVISQNLDSIIGLREQIITKARIENLKFEQISKKDTKCVKDNDTKNGNFKETMTVWKTKVQSLNNQILSQTQQKGELFTKLKQNVKEIQILKQQNQILKYTLETKQGKSSAQTVKNLLMKNRSSECGNCKQADGFIMKLSNDIVGLKKSLNTLKTQHQVLNSEHQFLKISYKNLEEESQRKMQIMKSEQRMVKERIQQLLSKKKEETKAKEITCSINGEQVGITAITARIRQLENVNVELSSQIQVLRETIQFKDSQLQQFRIKSLSITDSKQNKTPLKDMTNPSSNIPPTELDFKSHSKILQLQHQLKLSLQDLSTTKQQIFLLKQLNQKSVKDDVAYTSMLERISDEHENLVVASKAVEDELRRKVEGIEKELKEKEEEIVRLKVFGVEQMREIKEMQQTIRLQSLQLSQFSSFKLQYQQSLTTLSSTQSKLLQSQSLLQLYMNSISTLQTNSLACTREAEQLRIINHDLTLKNNRYQFVMKQRQGDMLLLNGEIVAKRKEVVEYVEKYLMCQKEKEETERKLTEMVLRNQEDVVGMYGEINRLRGYVHELQEQLRYNTQSNLHSPLSSNIYLQQIQQLKRIIKQRDRQYQDVYRLKKESDYKVYQEREECNKYVGEYMSQISLLKERVVELQTEGDEMRWKERVGV